MTIKIPIPITTLIMNSGEMVRIENSSAVMNDPTTKLENWPIIAPSSL